MQRTTHELRLALAARILRLVDGMQRSTLAELLYAARQLTDLDEEAERAGLVALLEGVEVTL